MNGELQQAFSEMALEEGVILSNEQYDFLVGTRLGRRASANILKLQFDFQGAEITVSNEMGQQNVGLIKCRFEGHSTAPDFSISQANLFAQAFAKTRNVLRIKCAEDALKVSIANNPHFLALCKLKRSTAFDPSIVGERVGNEYDISVEYHLQFKERALALKPLVSLCKDLVILLRST